MGLMCVYSLKKMFVRLFCSTILCFVACIHTHAQTVIGTNGMMNVPTADMRPAGTFDGGASLIQKELLYDKHYYTGLFYITFTPFSWIELTFRETIREYNERKREPYTNLDRSVSARIRPLKEGKYWPSVVLGANDFYDEGNNGKNFYASFYGVISKHFPIPTIGTLEATIGYAHPHKDGVTYDGVMGGLSFAPSFYPDMRIMGEYDTHGYNVGIGVFLFRHLNVTCFTREFKGINATMSYQFTIPY